MASTIRNAGRRPRDEVDWLIAEIRTITWAYEVIRISGLASATEVSRALQFHGHGLCNWHLYTRGHRTPSETMLSLIEQHWPTTKIVFDAGPHSVPVWNALFSAKERELEDIADVDASPVLSFMGVVEGSKSHAYWKAAIDTAKARLAFFQADSGDEELDIELLDDLNASARGLSNLLPRDAAYCVWMFVQAWYDIAYEKHYRRLLNRSRDWVVNGTVPLLAKKFSDQDAVVFSG